MANAPRVPAASRNPRGSSGRGPAAAPWPQRGEGAAGGLGAALGGRAAMAAPRGSRLPQLRVLPCKREGGVRGRGGRGAQPAPTHAAALIYAGVRFWQIPRRGAGVPGLAARVPRARGGVGMPACREAPALFGMQRGGGPQRPPPGSRSRPSPSNTQRSRSSLPRCERVAHTLLFCAGCGAGRVPRRTPSALRTHRIRFLPRFMAGLLSSHASGLSGAPRKSPAEAGAKQAEGNQAPLLDPAKPRRPSPARGDPEQQETEAGGTAVAGGRGGRPGAGNGDEKAPLDGRDTAALLAPWLPGTSPTRGPLRARPVAGEG